MLTDILLTVPVLLLFLAVAARCLVQCPPDPCPAAPDRREIVKVFACALALRAFMLSAMLLCSMLQGGDGLPGLFTRWDAKHYVSLAEQGYRNYQEDGQRLFLVFYPLYVWAVRLVRLAIPSTVAAGLAVSWLGYAWGCCFVYRIAFRCGGRQAARDSVTLLSLFPFSFFFGTVMTEGLFLLTTSAAFYYSMERRWLAYGVWGALAALTRMTGILLIVPAAVELLGGLRPLERPVGESLKRAAAGLLQKLPALLMPLLGSAGYLLLNLYADGDPFAFVGHQAHWYQGGMWVSRVLRYLWEYFLSNASGSNGYAIWLPELLIFAAAFTIILLSVRRSSVRPSLAAYTLCYLIANYSLSWLLSAGRYMSCCFSLFILSALLLRDRPGLRRGVCAALGVLLGIYLYAYTGGAQVM